MPQMFTPNAILSIATLLYVAPEVMERILDGRTKASDKTFGRCSGMLHAAEYNPSKCHERDLLRRAYNAMLTHRKAA